MLPHVESGDPVGRPEALLNRYGSKIEAVPNLFFEGLGGGTILCT